MSQDYEKSINQLKENLDKAKNLRIRAEARMEQLNRQKQEILAEIEALGVSPEDINSEIEKLEKEIKDLISEANELLPQDLINNAN